MSEQIPFSFLTALNEKCKSIGVTVASLTKAWQASGVLSDLVEASTDAQWRLRYEGCRKRLAPALRARNRVCFVPDELVGANKAFRHFETPLKGAQDGMRNYGTVLSWLEKQADCDLLRPHEALLFTPFEGRKVDPDGEFLVPATEAFYDRDGVGPSLIIWKGGKSRLMPLAFAIGSAGSNAQWIFALTR